MSVSPALRALEAPHELHLDYGTEKCAQYHKEFKEELKDESMVQLIKMFVAQKMSLYSKSDDEIRANWDPYWFCLTDNATYRAKILELFPFERILENLEAVEVDREGDYILYSCELMSGNRCRVLFMTCPSTGHQHANPVSDDEGCNTVKEAILITNRGVPADMFDVQT